MSYSTYRGPAFPNYSEFANVDNTHYSGGLSSNEGAVTGCPGPKSNVAAAGGDPGPDLGGSKIGASMKGGKSRRRHRTKHRRRRRKSTTRKRTKHCCRRRTKGTKHRCKHKTKSTKRKRRRRRRRMKGGYAQYQSNVPLSHGYSLGGKLPPTDNSLANPPPHQAYNHCQKNNFEQ